MRLGDGAAASLRRRKIKWLRRAVRGFDELAGGNRVGREQPQPLVGGGKKSRVRRGAYVAAANRAQQAVQEFQRSPSTEEALVILAQSYDRLGLVELRDDAQSVLKTNFPASTLTIDNYGRRKTPWWQLW
jgi:hypothetical protein